MEVAAPHRAVAPAEKKNCKGTQKLVQIFGTVGVDYDTKRTYRLSGHGSCGLLAALRSPWLSSIPTDKLSQILTRPLRLSLCTDHPVISSYRDTVSAVVRQSHKHVPSGPVLTEMVTTICSNPSVRNVIGRSRAWNMPAANVQVPRIIARINSLCCCRNIGLGSKTKTGVENHFHFEMANCWKPRDRSSHLN
jgi:hypothetical protein